MSRETVMRTRALGTGAVLCVTDPLALAGARRALDAEVAAIDLACSRFRPDSELQRLNGGAGRTHSMSPLLAEAVAVALDAAERTGGAVDPTVGRAVRAAGHDRTFPRLAPGGAPVPAPAGPAPGWRAVELDRDRATLRVPRGTLLDLGATAKALAADRAAAAAHRATGAGVLVSLGGDIAVAGEAPGGGWPVLIADTHEAPPDGPGPVVAVEAGGLATSSTTVRAWFARGRRMHHLVDPVTGEPAMSAWRTVSVVAPSCVEANTASTASVVMGDRAVWWLAEHGLPARLVARDGAVTLVAGWPEDPA